MIGKLVLLWNNKLEIVFKYMIIKFSKEKIVNVALLGKETTLLNLLKYYKR
jgi:hypothetical protein